MITRKELLGAEIKEFLKENRAEITYPNQTKELGGVPAIEFIRRHMKQVFLTEEDMFQLFREIEANLVMPFEGDLQNSSKEVKKIHEKITEYNREKFNQLKTKWTLELNNSKKIN